MSQLLLFEPQKGKEECAIANLEIFHRWANDGRITWNQYFAYRRQVEYQLYLKRQREQRAQN